MEQNLVFVVLEEKLRYSKGMNDTSQGSKTEDLKLKSGSGNMNLGADYRVTYKVILEYVNFTLIDST